MYFDLDTVVLDAAQAACIAIPGAGIPAALLRLRGRGWALVAPVSLIGTILAILLFEASADVVTWIALLLVPPGCALALGWAARGARPWMAVLTIPLLIAAIAGPEDTAGRIARIAMIVLSAATAGRLLAAAAPLRLLKAGVVVMAAFDLYFVLSESYDTQFASYDTAVPAAGLPRLQLARVGDVATDYGDFFVAGLVGALLAVERRPQALAAVAMLVVAEAFNQLFLVVESLPNTTAPALVLVGMEAWYRWRRRGTAAAPAPGGGG